jgi:UDP-N-acetylglucosamine:LPS N-acetylglucosamine transferase
MHKESFIINRNTLLHVSTLLGHPQWELFVTVTLRLHFTVERECAVDCVLCTGGMNSLGPGLQALQCRPGQQTVHASKNNAVHSQQHILTQL